MVGLTRSSGRAYDALTAPRSDAPRHRGATKPFSQADEKVLKQRRPSVPVAQTTGFDHVGPHPQRGLPGIPQGSASRHGRPVGKAMTEVVTALCVFFSISIFLAHAVDAFRVR
jgi:hypothetical protein